MLVIGLTGGIGTGKSEVSRILRDLGATVINADHVGHEAYTPQSQMWREVVAAFGEGILQPSGEIDRKRLGDIVFNEPGAMAKLNSIMHPRMAEMIRRQIEELREQDVKLVVLEAALMVEAGWSSMVDELWVTYAPEELVLERLRQRNNMSDEEIRSRISSQLPFEERARYARMVVHNSGSVAELREKVESLWSRVRGKVS